MSNFGSSQFGTAVFGSHINPWLSSAGNVMWMAQVDWDQDGIFDSLIEPQTITGLTFTRGRKSRINTLGNGQERTDKETFRLDIYDPGGRYDPSNSSSPIYAYMGMTGIAFRILAVSSTSRAQAEPLFVGTLTRVGYDAKTQSAVLAGEGCSRLLQMGAAEHVYTPVQGIVTQAVDTVFTTGWDDYFVRNAGPLTPVPTNYWKGRLAGLPLQECVNLVLERIGWSFGQFESAKQYTVDQPDYFYMDGSSAWEILASLANGFAGRLFLLRNGQVMMMDRQDALGRAGSVLTAPSGALEDAGLDMPSPFEVLRNSVEVVQHYMSVYPFVTTIPDAAYQVLWQNSGPIELASGQYMVFDVDLQVNSKPAQCSQFYPGGGYVTKAAFQYPDRTGTDYSSSLGFGCRILSSFYSGTPAPGNWQKNYLDNQQRGRVSLMNLSTATIFAFDLKVYGIPIVESPVTGGSLAEDVGSMADYGKRVLQIDSPWVQNKEMADQVAGAYLSALSKRELASPATLEYAWSGETLYQNLLAYDLGTFVDFGAVGGALALSNYGLAGQWLVVGQQVTWMDATGQNARVRLTFERTPTPVVSVAMDSVSTATVTNASGITWAHTVSDGDNRLLMVMIDWGNWWAGGTRDSIASVKYGGVTLTRLTGTTWSTSVIRNLNEDIYYLLSPAVGTANVVVTLASGADNFNVTSVSLENVNQGAPFGTPVSFSDYYNVGTLSLTVATNEGDLVIDASNSYVKTPYGEMDQLVLSRIIGDSYSGCILTGTHTYKRGQATQTVISQEIAQYSQYVYLAVAVKSA